MRITNLAVPALLLSFAALSGCARSDKAGAGADAPVGGGKYSVTVTRTQLGIPHIKADNFGSMGYGYGYAFAEDNLCVLQEDLVTVRGERARHFGAEGTHYIVPNQSVADNVSSDFFWKFMATDAAWQHLRDAADPELRLVTSGFVDGYNRYIGELESGRYPGRHASCANADWLFPITEADMYRRYYRLALIASSSVFVDAIAELQPPPPGGGAAPAPLSEAQLSAALRSDPGPFAAFSEENRDRFGSNMYALSAGATGGQSMVFGNPHFPWTGTERLYISHLTIPGKVDIMGSSLYGVPAVLIGFTDHFAWSHTVSTAYRFTIYELTLNPENPTQYVYDGALRDMTAVPLSIEVKNADGTLATLNRTLYRSHYGPMMTIVASGQRILPWTNEKAYTLRDVNAENDRLINQFARWNLAQSLTEFITLHKTVLGIPWVNTVASGPNQAAYYGDVSVVPHVTDAQIQTCAAHPIHDVVQQVALGLPVLDGSRSACEWGDDTANPDAEGISAPVKGIFGPKNLPTLLRADWVHNCNDSYWLTHPDEPTEGYNSIIGPERTARSLRTRLCMLQVLRHLDGDNANDFDGNDDHLFDLDELQETVLSSQIYTAQLARDDLVDNICAFGMVLGQSGPVDVSGACDVLAGWDLSANSEAVGTHIWREFWRKAAPNAAGIGPNPLLWLTPFSADDAVNTPSGLNVASPFIQAALGDAVKLITDRGFALDARFGSLQHPREIDPGIEIFGGEGFEGAFTIANSTDISKPAAERGLVQGTGYGIHYGNSYIQTVTWEADGAGFKPLAEGFITYSQSTDPASPHYSDFTREYAAKRWKRFPFRPAEIEADKISEMRLTE